MNKYKKISCFLIIISLVLLISGISFIIFQEEQENIVYESPGSIFFIYDDKITTNKINIYDFTKLSDIDGKNSSLNTFDFKIKANTKKANLNYEITLKNNNIFPIDMLKVYLEEINELGEVIEEYEVIKYSDLLDTNLNTGEKSLYKETVNPNTNNFSKNFRLSIWISDEYQEDITEMELSFTVNVYANCDIVISSK